MSPTTSDPKPDYPGRPPVTPPTRPDQGRPGDRPGSPPRPDHDLPTPPAPKPA
jgi:hypothetical protein